MAVYADLVDLTVCDFFEAAAFAGDFERPDLDGGGVRVLIYGLCSANSLGIDVLLNSRSTWALTLTF